MGSFQIPDPNQTASSGSQVVFTVTNVDAEDLQARVSIPGDPAQLEMLKIPLEKAAKTEWFAFDGPRERNFPAGIGTTVGVTPNVPAGTAPGDYLFCLQVAAVTDPDNNSEQSPVITLSVGATPPPPPPPSKKWWLWILIALVVLAVLGVGGKLIYDWLNQNDPQSQPAGAAWFAGNWSGTIDGRPAVMQWQVSGEKRRPSYSGKYSFDNGQTFQPLTYVAHRSDELDLRSGEHPWQIKLLNSRQVTGWASFDGERFPIALQKQ